ncbi:MAG: hypothetical protein ACR2F8_03920 [Caulobacteraceae bacterium]
MADFDLAPAPFTSRFGRSAEACDQARLRLAAAGVRALPYPFASAMSIISDCDGSSRPRYQAYVESFISRGLDFGDSTWLHWNNRTGLKVAGGLGFFSYTYSKGLFHDAGVVAPTRTFAESVAEYHAGNIDHLHSLFRDGPRVVVVDCPRGDGETIEVFTGPFQIGGPWRTDDLHLVALLIEGECAGATVIEQDGFESDCSEPLTPPLAGQTLLALPFNPETENRGLPVRGVGAIRLREAHNVKRILMLSCHSAMLIERVHYLRGFNIELSLITEHSRLYFRHPGEAAQDDKAATKRLAERDEPLPALYGEVSDGDGLVVSTDADDPRSPCRVLPDLFDFGLRFVAPAACDTFEGVDLMDVVRPTPTRAGGGGYWARRTLPLGKGPNPRTHQETFAQRMRAALTEADQRPGQAWPIYTHLGVMDLDAGRAGPPFIPEPYFDEADMAALRNRALGISGAGERMWLARATPFYDYCLIIQAIADHVRRDGDLIDIDSWRDPALGRILPCSPAQLFGITFYVDDSAKACVRLDGRPIEALSRNSADATGRQSVTILESEIRSIVFEKLDPLANHPGEAEIVGDCAWREGALAVDGTLTLPMHGWSAPAAQAFEFDARGSFGIRLRTVNGGSFYFGHPRWVDGSDDATYAFPGGGEGRHVAPLYDLAWRARECAHAPSHALASITFTGQARFARVGFLRPRATTLARAGFCVAGQVPRFERGQTVQLGERREAVDQRGWFCFPATPAGIYPLTSDCWCDRRGRLVEIGSDTVNLRLDRPL